MVVLTLCILTDLLQIYRLARGQVPIKIGSALPQGPDLPISWHITMFSLEVLAALCQLIIGYTLISGLIMVFVFGGAQAFFHLNYFSGVSLKENASTLLPITAMTILSIFMVLTAPAEQRGAMGIPLYGDVLWILLMVPAGAISCYVYLTFQGIQKKEPDENQPIINGDMKA